MPKSSFNVPLWSLKMSVKSLNMSERILNISESSQNMSVNDLIRKNLPCQCTPDRDQRPFEWCECFELHHMVRTNRTSPCNPGPTLTLVGERSLSGQRFVDSRRIPLRVLLLMCSQATSRKHIIDRFYWWEGDPTDLPHVQHPQAERHHVRVFWLQNRRIQPPLVKGWVLHAVCPGAQGAKACRIAQSTSDGQFRRCQALLHCSDQCRALPCKPCLDEPVEQCAAKLEHALGPKNWSRVEKLGIEGVWSRNDTQPQEHSKKFISSGAKSASSWRSSLKLFLWSEDVGHIHIRWNGTAQVILVINTCR